MLLSWLTSKLLSFSLRKWDLFHPPHRLWRYLQCTCSIVQHYHSQYSNLERQHVGLDRMCRHRSWVHYLLKFWKLSNAGSRPKCCMRSTGSRNCHSTSWYKYQSFQSMSPQCLLRQMGGVWNNTRILFYLSIGHWGPWDIRYEVSPLYTQLPSHVINHVTGSCSIETRTDCRNSPRNKWLYKQLWSRNHYG